MLLAPFSHHYILASLNGDEPTETIEKYISRSNASTMAVPSVSTCPRYLMAPVDSYIAAHAGSYAVQLSVKRTWDSR
jgi:hypothetical protein